LKHLDVFDSILLLNAKAEHLPPFIYKKKFLTVFVLIAADVDLYSV
jgi:hypothetical protein